MIEKSPAEALLLIVNYNHEKEIGSVLDRVKTVLASSPWKIEPLVIDDHSRDQSPAIASSKGFQVLRHDRNLGVGAAIRTGLQYGLQNGFDRVVMISANGKMQPEEILTVLAPIMEGRADYVQGSRNIAGGNSQGLSLFRTFAIPVFSAFTSILLRRWFSDITCGFRAYRLQWLTEAPINIQQDWLNRYELEFYVHYWACRKGLEIIEVPVSIVYSHLEKGRKSYIRPFTGWWSMTRPFLLLALGFRK